MDSEKLTAAFEPCAMKMVRLLLSTKEDSGGQRQLSNDELTHLSVISQAQSAKRQADALERIAIRIEDVVCNGAQINVDHRPG